MLKAADSLETWGSSPYGSFIGFYNQRTFSKIKAAWTSYSSRWLSPEEKAAQQKQLSDAFQKAQGLRRKQVGEDSIILTGIRSAAPASVRALDILPKVTKNWWKTGTVDSDKKSPPHLNPTFLSSSNKALTLHYGLEPLLGFPLAPAFVPGTLKYPFQADEDIVKCARTHFRGWIGAFRQAAGERCVLRFCLADATAFCRGLQAKAAGEPSETPSLFCDNWTFEPLVLESGAYQNGPSKAPTSFNVIDTSNLMDHLGALNILMAAAPLLKPEPSSTLYTELLVRKQSRSVQDRIESLLCGDFQTIALIFGLAPVEVWTNASSSTEADEAMVQSFMDTRDKQLDKESTSSRTRLYWKKLGSHISSSPSCKHDVPGPIPVEINSTDLSRLIYSIYSAMFRHEDARTLEMNIKAYGLSKMSNILYNRASFAALASSVQEHVRADWNKTIIDFLKLVEQNITLFSMGSNFLQELYLYLHLLSVHSVDILKRRIEAQPQRNALSPCFMEANPPAVVCVTVEVPLASFKRFIGLAQQAGVTPLLCCTLRTSSWSNSFAAVQIGFGNIEWDRGSADTDSSLEILADPLGWDGHSPLIASFYAPSWVLLQDSSSILIGCGVLHTPHALMTFARHYGPQLTFFETKLTDSSKVSVTRFMPNLKTYPTLAYPGCAIASNSQASEEFEMSVVATIAPTNLRVTHLACRVDFKSEAAKAKLAESTAKVQVDFQSPLRYELSIATPYRLTISLPTAVTGSQYKVRIARKSSYVEVVVPLWNPVGAPDAPFFTLPVHSSPRKIGNGSAVPINLNLPRLDLDQLPEINHQVPQDIDWLTTHMSAAFSDRERRTREAGLAGKLPLGTAPDIRIEIKEGLFSIFMQYTGLQGRKVDSFALSLDASGVHVLIFPSTLRLDLISRTVALDAAIIPLTLDVLHDPKMQQFLAAQQKFNLCQVRVTDGELRAWKAMLPALAERCRTWTHQSDCEYTSCGEVPLSQGLAEARTPLCSCGLGHFPDGYLKHRKVPHLEHALRKYATRVALAPIFAVPYVEGCFSGQVPADSPKDMEQEVPSRQDDKGCFTCGRSEKKSTGGKSEALLVCVRCKKAKYCSADCQKADWKKHKTSCGTSL